MLPSIVPDARIMRYGYESQWFGSDAIRQKATTVASRFLLALKRERAVRVLMLTRPIRGTNIVRLPRTTHSALCCSLHTALAGWSSCRFVRCGLCCDNKLNITGPSRSPAEHNQMAGHFQFYCWAVVLRYTVSRSRGDEPE